MFLVVAGNLLKPLLSVKNGLPVLIFDIYKNDVVSMELVCEHIQDKKNVASSLAAPIYFLD